MKPNGTPALPGVTRGHGLHWQCASLLVLIAALFGCAGGARTEQNGSYVFRADNDFVRLAPIEPAAPPNAHPFSISADQLQRLLAGVEVQRAAAVGKAPVFAKDELERVVAPLASALSKAGPNQDVTFAVTGRRGLFGSVAPRTITTGRLFATGGSLHLIFGLMQERLDASTLDYSAKNPTITPGARSHRVGDTIWKLEPGRARFHQQRGDWLVFARSDIPAAPATQAVPSTPDAGTKSGGEAPTKAQEFENRLRVLDALKEKGLITEQEYRERRRAILEQL